MIKGTGWLPDLPDWRDYVYDGDGEQVSDEPLALSTKQSPVDYFSDKVLDQGYLGSCVWNGIASMVRYERYLAGLPDLELSRLFGYYFTRRLQGWEDFDSGCFIRDAFIVLDADGCVPETDWAYDDGEERFRERPPQILLHEALGNQVDSIGAAVGSTLRYLRLPHEEARVYRCLDSGHPFVFGATLYDSFDSAQVADTGVVPMPGRNERTIGGHLMTACSRKIKPGYITTLNSWDYPWGDGGFCHIPVEYLLNPNLCDDLWTLRPSA
jgi:hypothetical protein